MDFHCTAKDNIIFIKKNATSSYWDDLWNNDPNWIGNFTKGISLNGEFVRMFRKVLPEGASILEAGCGQGQFVYALSKNGFNVLGIDYAKRTVDLLNENMPELNIQLGDVTNLKNIDNASFDAYYSGGVIEHFWEGYDSIISEAHRILKKGGHMVITFPFLSVARRKAMKSLPKWEESAAPKGFYQFALDPEETIREICDKGFTLIHRRSRNGTKGFLELYPDFPIISSIYYSKRRNVFIKVIKRVLGRIFAAIGYGHTIELIFLKS